MLSLVLPKGSLEKATLDLFDAAEDRVAHPFRCRRVRDDGTAAVVGGFDNALDLAEGEAWTRFAIRAPAVIGVDLDQVHAMRNLVARHAHDAIEAIGFVSALRHRPLGRKSLGRVAAGHHRQGVGADRAHGQHIAGEAAGAAGVVGSGFRIRNKTGDFSGRGTADANTLFPTGITVAAGLGIGHIHRAVRLTHKIVRQIEGMILDHRFNFTIGRDLLKLPVFAGCGQHPQSPIGIQCQPARRIDHRKLNRLF